MTSEYLKNWQLAMGYTQQQAAAALGVSRATYRDKLNGKSRNTGKPVLIDRVTELACAYLLLNNLAKLK
jgi:transcriptional regulator with XRE-family HTH domain